MMLDGVHKVVCVGDSITQMGDDAAGHGYVKLIRETLTRAYPDAGIEVINAGISGQQAPDMLARWNHDVIERHPDLVTLSVGINDVWHGFYDHHLEGDGPRAVAIDRYLSDVGQMVDSALAAHIRVVLVSPTVITESRKRAENLKLHRFVEAERELARERKVLFVDLHNTFLDVLARVRTSESDPTRHLTSDGVHMLPDGDRLMAHTILHKLGVPASELEDLGPQ
jgi:lysophospholipase L1-like esterase